MTANDTTYFLSDPKVFWNQGDKWANTFKFIENTCNKRKHNYTPEEIQERLENVLTLKRS